MTVLLHIPIRLNSETNQKDCHWSQRSKRRDAIRETVILFLNQKISERRRAGLKLTSLKMARFGKGELDSDNLQSAFKSVRDVICAAFGQDDSHRSGIQFAYAQTSGSDYSIMIELTVTEK